MYDSSAGADYGTAGSDAVVTDVDDPQPTFTPVDDGTVDDSSLTDVPVAAGPRRRSAKPTTCRLCPPNTTVTEAPLSSATDLDPNAPLLGDPSTCGRAGSRRRPASSTTRGRQSRTRPSWSSTRPRR